MKRKMILLLAAIMLLAAGCTEKPQDPANMVTPDETVPAVNVTADTTTDTVDESFGETETEIVEEEPESTPEEPPAEPVPECVTATVQVNDAPAILMLLNRGDVVDVVSEYDENHYIVKTEQGYGLVEKQLLRMSDEPAFELWTGYAKGNTAVYDNYQLTGEPVQALGLNTQIEILDELKYCYVVKAGEVTGYVLKDQVSTHYIHYSNGGGGGSSGGADGGDISLGVFRIATLSAIEQLGDVSGQAEVLADGTQVILGYFQREETVPIVAEDGFAPAWEGYYTLYIEGFYVYMPKNLALLEGEEPYSQWSGFADYNATVYDNRLLLGEGEKLRVNTDVTVLWDGGDFCLVSVNGELGYMDIDQIGENRFYTGGGGGGSSGGDWTPPAL